MNITDMTAVELARAVTDGKISAELVVRSYIGRVRGENELNNFITVTETCAERAARIIDGMCKTERTSLPLAGVTVAVKDNIDVEGEQTTCASLALCDALASKDAAVVARLKIAGAVIVGKTNMDEFAMGSTNELSAFKAVKNALDPSRVPGGSSGGSANCVSARQALCALGTDTGGSVRQPAALCGVVGLKPTFGAISTDGIRSLAPSLDTVGLFARDCDDAHLIFNAAVGQPTASALSGDVRGVTVGVIDISGIDVSAAAACAFEGAEAALKAAGADIVRVKIPSIRAALSAYHVLSSAEASRSLIKLFDGKADRLAFLGDEVKRRMILGALVTDGARYGEIYMRAARVRTVVKREFAAALSCADVIVSPAAADIAARLGALSDPDAVHSSDVFTAPVSLAGLPAVSVPFGRSGGLPIGMQVIGQSDRETDILNVGKAIMRAQA